jgi:non-ribosomal peptide synthetase component F
MKRRRDRIQPYVSPEIHQKLRALAAARNLTESAIAEAAFAEYLDRDRVNEDLIVRRLDAVTRELAELRHEVQVVGQAVANFAVYSFHNPPTRGSEARARADQTYQEFLRTIAKQVQAGMRLSGEVRRAARAIAPAPPPPAEPKGGR